MKGVHDERNVGTHAWVQCDGLCWNIVHPSRTVSHRNLERRNSESHKTEGEHRTIYIEGGGEIPLAQPSEHFFHLVGCCDAPSVLHNNHKLSLSRQGLKWLNEGFHNPCWWTSQMHRKEESVFRVRYNVWHQHPLQCYSHPSLYEMYLVIPQLTYQTGVDIYIMHKIAQVTWLQAIIFFFPELCIMC